MGLGWNDLQVVAAVVSAVCAIVAATVSVMVWRKSQATDLSSKIDHGDRATRKHADKAIAEVNTQLSQNNQRLGELEDGVARIEASQKHFLVGRDLSPIHEKINRVAEQVAASNATGQALREQLRVIHELLMRGNR